MDANPPFKERRKNPHEPIESYQAVIRQHFDERFDSLEKTLKSAFPNGDLEGHRRAHETVIAMADDRARLWKTVLEKTISGSIWAAVVLLAMALWEFIKDRIKS